MLNKPILEIIGDTLWAWFTKQRQKRTQLEVHTQKKGIGPTSKVLHMNINVYVLC